MVVVLAIRVVFGRPVLDSLMFAVALAVGLTPELLPMITTVTLSRGALRMARRKVIVKRLASIHDLGSMTVLCTDKTGTLTSAEISLARSLNLMGADDPRASRLGAIAAQLGGDRGSLDAALTHCAENAAAGWTLAGRHAFDFSRRVGSVLTNGPEGSLLIVKGAPEGVLPLCTKWMDGAATAPMESQQRADISAQIHNLAGDGLRCIAVASRPWSGPTHDVDAKDEADLVFEGLCAFADPPKPTAAAAIARLAKAGIRLKILSGDDPVVVKRLAGLVGLKTDTVLSGADIVALSDDALAVQVQFVDAYGRLAPDQKSRIVKALQARGAVVGFLGDGINDAPGLKVADIGLSVDGATGVAQEAADMILRIGPGGSRRRRRRGSADFCQHSEICAHGCQLEFRQHAIDGRGLDRAAIPADVADADPTEQSALRSFRNRHSVRYGAPGSDGPAAGMGYTRAGSVRSDHGADVIVVRLPDICRAGFLFQGIACRIPDRLVSRVDGDANPRHLRRSY